MGDPYRCQRTKAMTDAAFMALPTENQVFFLESDPQAILGPCFAVFKRLDGSHGSPCMSARGWVRSSCNLWCAFHLYLDSCQRELRNACLIPRWHKKSGRCNLQMDLGKGDNYFRAIQLANSSARRASFGRWS